MRYFGIAGSSRNRASSKRVPRPHRSYGMRAWGLERRCASTLSLQEPISTCEPPSSLQEPSGTPRIGGDLCHRYAARSLMTSNAANRSNRCGSVNGPRNEGSWGAQSGVTAPVNTYETRDDRETGYATVLGICVAATGPAS